MPKQVLMYVSQRTGKRKKTPQKKTAIFCGVPACHHESRWKWNLFWQRGHLSFCLHTRNQSESIPLGFHRHHADSHLLYCARVFWRGQERWQHTSDSAIHHTSTHQDTSGQRGADVQGAERQWGLSYWCSLKRPVQYQEIKTNALRWNHNFLMLSIIFNSIFSFFPLPSSPFQPFCLSSLTFNFHPLLLRMKRL